MTRRLAARGLLVAAALLLSGCAIARPPSPFDPDQDGPNQILIVVRNLNFNEARIWALRGGRRTRLGTVGGNADEEFRMDWQFSESLRLEIDLVAGENCTTRPLRVDPGDRIEFRIESNFRLTSVCR